MASAAVGEQVQEYLAQLPPVVCPAGRNPKSVTTWMWRWQVESHQLQCVGQFAWLG
jgi:hypothetical protein